MRKASKALKRLLFMKIYNFAVEVYDSPGSRIGCWRSCGQQEWELISHEVILQPLFSSSHSLNSSNTSFSWLFVYALRVRAVVVGCCARVILPKKKKWATAWRVAFACVRHVNDDCYMFVKMSDHHTPGRWDYFPQITWTKWGRGLRGGERSFGGVAPTQGMMDYQQR